MGVNVILLSYFEGGT